MVDGAEGKNTGSFPQENSCAKENQSYANQLSNLHDVFEENKRKNIADLNAQIRAYTGRNILKSISLHVQIHKFNHIEQSKEKSTINHCPHNQIGSSTNPVSIRVS